MSEKVSIKDLNKADVLAAMYNASQPMGMGFLQAGGAPLEMNRTEAESLLSGGPDVTGDYPTGTAAMRGQSYFDYVHGRPLKLDLSSDEEFDPWGFDRDNGGDGAAQRVVDNLRATGSVASANERSFADSQMSESDALMFMLGALGRFNQQS